MAHVTYGGYRPPQAAAHSQPSHQPGGQPLPHRGPLHPGYAAAPPAGDVWGNPHQPYAPPGYPQPEPQPYASFPAAEPQGYAPAADPLPYPQSPATRAGGGAGATPTVGSGDEGAAPGMARLVNLAGAALSVALLLGVGLWSYRLMVRDVSGVPVIQALEGPIRRSPDDPGGRQAPYQELSVNTVAAQGEAAGAARIVAVAPPPVQLTDEDRAIAEMTTTRAAPITAPSSPAILAPQVQPQQIAAPAPIQPAAPLQSAAALELVPASAPGVSRSPLPPRRPGAVTRIAAAAPVAAAPSAQVQPVGAVDAQAEAVLQDLVTRLAPPTVTEIDPSTLAPGTRLVQLSVYESADEARGAWDQLAARFPAYLDGRSRIIDSAAAGGRTFYRLRAHGFVDEPEARRFCSIFLAQGVDCIPVLTGR